MTHRVPYTIAVAVFVTVTAIALCGHLDHSLGYMKDMMAMIAFAILAYMVHSYDVHRHKAFVLTLLVIGLMVDGTFTVIPDLHNRHLVR